MNVEDEIAVIEMALEDLEQRRMDDLGMLSDDSELVAILQEQKSVLEKSIQSIFDQVDVQNLISEHETTEDDLNQKQQQLLGKYFQCFFY